MGNFERQFYDAQLRISNEFQAQELQNGNWGLLGNGNFLNGGYVIGQSGGNRKGKGKNVLRKHVGTAPPQSDMQPLKRELLY